MPHYHHCEVCKIPVAMCSDEACKTAENHPNGPDHHDGGGDPEKAGKHYCNIHHPAEAHHLEPTPYLTKAPKK